MMAAWRNQTVLSQALRAYPWSFMGFLLLCMIVPKLYELSSFFWAGRISADAVSIAEQQEFLAIMIEVINEAAAVGVLALVAQRAGQRDDVLGAIRAGLFVGLVGAGLLTMTLWLTPHLFIKAIGTPPSLVTATSSYLRVRAWGLPFDAAGLVLLTALKALRRARLALVIIIVGTLMNAGLDILLVSDTRFSLHLGVPGIALTFVLTKVSVCVMAAIVCQRILRIGIRDLAQGIGTSLPRFFSAGGWAGLDSLVRNVGYVLLLTVLNALGAQAFAGYGLAMTVIWTGLLPVLALTEGTNILVGNLYGQRRDEEVDRTIAVSIALVLLAMAGLMLLGLFRWHSIAGFLNPHIGIVDASNQVFLSLALAYVLFAVSQILKSLFIGSGRTANLFIVSMLINGVLVIPYVVVARWRGSPPQFAEMMRLVGAALILDFLLTSLLAWRVRRAMIRSHGSRGQNAAAFPGSASVPPLFSLPAME